MKVTLESTTKIIEVNGIPCRIWEGETSSGTKVHAFVTRIGHDLDEPDKVKEQFQKELQECKTPSPEVAAIPLRLIL